LPCGAFILTVTLEYNAVHGRRRRRRRRRTRIRGLSCGNRRHSSTFALVNSAIFWHCGLRWFTVNQQGRSWGLNSVHAFFFIFYYFFLTCRCARHGVTAYMQLRLWKTTKKKTIKYSKLYITIEINLIFTPN
jgi:hypothetical protein